MALIFNVRRRHLVLVTLAAILITVTAEPLTLAASLNCSRNRCGLLTDGDYRNLVIGRLVHVGSDAEMQSVYRWAKAHGYWKSLPNSPVPYLHDVKLVTIALPRSIAKQPVTVFMQVEEYNPAPLATGTLVRYSPHGSAHEAPPKADANELALYHGLTGCVAVLCGAHDAACFGRYRQGVYTKAHGQPVNPKTGTLIAGGESIDPISLLPRDSHGRATKSNDARKGLGNGMRMGWSDDRQQSTCQYAQRSDGLQQVRHVR